MSTPYNWSQGANSQQGAATPTSTTPTSTTPTSTTPTSTPPPPSRSPGENPWVSADGRTQSQSSPWAAVRKPQQERVTSRLRRVVEGLPDWEPLPPGETVVRRPGTTP